MIGATSLWVGIGFLGQAMFFMRFLVQWIRSEQEQASVVPMAFWYFSLAGGTIMLTYAIWRRDPVFIVGQAGGLLIYLRNLYLIHAGRRRIASAGGPGDADRPGPTRTGPTPTGPTPTGPTPTGRDRGGP